LTVKWLIYLVVTTTSVILCSDKVQNRDTLVPANPGSSGKWPLKWRERERERERETDGRTDGWTDRQTDRIHLFSVL